MERGMGEISEALRRAARSFAPDERAERESSAKSTSPLRPPPDLDLETEELSDSDLSLALLRSDAESSRGRLPESARRHAPPSEARREPDKQTISRQAAPERISVIDPMAPASVSARHLAQHLKRRADRVGIRSIVLTSPLSGDGKTTTACNLAVALSQLDQSRAVALVDLDMRRPRVAKSLGLRVSVGVEDVLADRAPLDEAIIETDVPGLSVIAVRRSVEKPEPLLASSRLADLIQGLHARFGTVVIDTPPILAVSDASGIIDVADACLLVVRAGRSPTPSVRRAAEQLPSEKALGCCLNFARGSARSSGYEYYGYRSQEGDDAEVETMAEDSVSERAIPRAAIPDAAISDAAMGARE